MFRPLQRIAAQHRVARAPARPSPCAGAPRWTGAAPTGPPRAADTASGAAASPTGQLRAQRRVDSSSSRSASAACPPRLIRAKPSNVGHPARRVHQPRQRHPSQSNLQPVDTGSNFARGEGHSPRLAAERALRDARLAAQRQSILLRPRRLINTGPQHQRCDCTERLTYRCIPPDQGLSPKKTRQVPGALHFLKAEASHLRLKHRACVSRCGETRDVKMGSARDPLQHDALPAMTLLSPMTSRLHPGPASTRALPAPRAGAALAQVNATLRHSTELEGPSGMPTRRSSRRKTSSS